MSERNNGTLLKESLRKAISDRKADILFEAQLSRRGILDDLQESGVLPTVEHRNPYDARTHTRAHDNYWREHPDEQRDYIEKTRLRDRALRLLRIGGLLNDGQ